MTNKYGWVIGSVSKHDCCFKATVVDLETRQAVCECYHEETAEVIARTLNAAVGPIAEAGIGPKETDTIH